MFKNINKRLMLLVMLFTMFLGIIPQLTHSYAITSDNVTIDSNYQVTFENENALDTEGVIDKYKGLLVTFSTLCTITLMGFLIFNVTRLAGSAHNPFQRQQAIMALIWNFIAIAIFGSITFWFMFSYSFLDK